MAIPRQCNRLTGLIFVLVLFLIVPFASGCGAKKPTLHLDDSAIEPPSAIAPIATPVLEMEGVSTSENPTGFETVNNPGENPDGEINGELQDAKQSREPKVVQSLQPNIPTAPGASQMSMPNTKSSAQSFQTAPEPGSPLKALKPLPKQASVKTPAQ